MRETLPPNEKEDDMLEQQRSQSPPKLIKSIEYPLTEPLSKGMSNLTLTENLLANKSLASLDAKERI